MSARKECIRLIRDVACGVQKIGGMEKPILTIF